MKKTIFFILCVMVLIMTVSCSKVKTDTSCNSDISLNEQTIEQLRVSEPTEINTENSDVINYENQVGMWFTYMDYLNILKGKSEDEFTKSIRDNFKSVKDMGVNTLYVHVRAFNDSYYKSKLFPRGEYYDSDYDPLKIMLTEAHKLKLSVHAWINPLRCQTDEQLNRLDDGYMIKQWYDSKNKNGTYIVKIGDNWYLNPAYEEVREYVSKGVEELLKYPVDGIHIDDYFYPTTDETFDASAFAQSGKNELSEWRLENINQIIREIYSTVKAENESLLFGISPQGNVSANYENQYADVKKWLSEEGYCDYVVPQIYFGFENETRPFKETVKLWQQMNTNSSVKLMIGLCTYKIGNEDKWAGSGKNEWIENRDIVSQQAEYCFENDLNIAIYSFDSTFSDNLTAERKSLSEMIIKNYGGDNS